MRLHPQALTLLFLTLVGSHAMVARAIAGPLRTETGAESLPTNEGSTPYVLEKLKAKPPRYDYAAGATDEQMMAMKTSSLFFLEKDMHPGKKISLHISKDTTTTPTFIPLKVSDSLPFTSNKLQNIYDLFKVNPDSVEAKLIEKTINDCEKASNKGEDQFCATSFESMVDFATSKLGKRVKPTSTHVDGNENTMLHEYKVKALKKLHANSLVVCHQEYYAYAVHYCHKSSNIHAYKISLVGENNVRAKAISVCHEDTASWNPNHLAFQVLNVKPGTASICHFLLEDDVALVPY